MNATNVCVVEAWRDTHREVCALAKRRCADDVLEAGLLCRVIRDEVWRHVGCVTLYEYLEMVLGYGPRVARDRVRVALALQDLPLLAQSLKQGEHSYSAMRELTRVVTPATQHEWLDAASGKRLRQIEELVAARKPGDLPTDPRDETVRKVLVTFEVLPSEAAELAEVRRMLADEFGERLDDGPLLAILCAAVRAGGSGNSARARNQVMTTICEKCHDGWVDGAGRQAKLSQAEVERAECDAQRIGSDRAPARATQDVSPKTRRHVWRRDHGKCCVPGCRSTRNLDIHHIVPRERNGSHDADNLTLCCGGHHGLLHDGKLAITGRAPDIVVTRIDREAHVGHTIERHAGTERPRRPLEELIYEAVYGPPPSR